MTVPVLLPLALPAPYDYLVPEGMQVAPGQFVVAPLGPVDYLGVVWPRPEGEAPPEIERKKLREIIEVVDDVPKLPPVSLDFADWVASYTLSSPGMVLRMMMSAGRAFEPPAPRYGVRLAGPPPERMTQARARVLAAANNGLIWVKSSLAEAAGVSPGVIDGLVDSGALIAEPLPDWHDIPLDLSRQRAKLSPEQAEAARDLLANTNDGFSVSLLDGVTGSGKTEVYFEAIAAALTRGKQVLVLMPEIALTSQFIARCEERFGARPAEWHSGVSAPLRGRIWRAVAENKAKLVVGARSALFLPFPDLGLIVVDEEHDQSYKQEERVAYQARDMAVVRGHLGRCPVVLSSATPSIESLVNAEQGRYRHIRLGVRYKAAGLPAISAIDMRNAPPERGRWLSPVLVDAVAETLARGEQALLFLNRRGYAPVTLCRKCGFKFECPNCSAWLVEHRFRRRLECHHCGTYVPIPEQCPSCRAEHSLVPCGPGSRAHRRGGGRALPRGAARAAVERPHAEHQRFAPDLARDRGTRGGYHHRHAARRQGPSLSGARTGRRGRRRSRSRAGRSARGRAHLPAAQSGDRSRRPRRHCRPRADPNLHARASRDPGARLRRPRHLSRARDRSAARSDVAAVRSPRLPARQRQRARCRRSLMPAPWRWPHRPPPRSRC